MTEVEFNLTGLSQSEQRAWRRRHYRMNRMWRAYLWTLIERWKR